MGRNGRFHRDTRESFIRFRRFPSRSGIGGNGGQNYSICLSSELEIGEI